MKDSAKMENGLEGAERSPSLELSHPPLSWAGSAGGVNEIAISVYERTLAGQAVTVFDVASDLDVPHAVVERTMHDLLELKLIRFCRKRDKFVAVSPESAQVELILPLEQEIHDKRREMTQKYRELRPFNEMFTRFQRSQQRQDVVVVSKNQRETQLRIAHALRHCKTEILGIWSLDRCGTQILTDTMPLALEGLRHGIQLRSLYPHGARSHTRMRADLQKEMISGAEVRTSGDISDFLLIVDNDVAFLPKQLPAGPAVTAVYEPTIVNLLRRIYENFWESASEFETSDSSHGDTFNELRATILRMLASGVKDEVIARRVGVSTRTLRRHISTIMEELRADSRFQAGVAAASAGLVEIEDPAEAAAPPA